jgi:hypothetical protein
MENSVLIPLSHPCPALLSLTLPACLTQIENLLHIISCGPTDSFALDFELTGKEGFTAKDAVQPVIQVAFQYTIAVPAGGCVGPSC